MPTNRKLMLLLIPIAALLACCIAVLCIINTPFSAYEVYTQKLEQAEKYLLNSNYDEAIKYYEAAISADDTQEDAYLKIAEVYHDYKGNIDEAISWLSKGYEKTFSEKIKTMLAVYISERDGQDVQSVSTAGTEAQIEPTTALPTTVPVTTVQPTTQKQKDDWKQLYISAINDDNTVKQNDRFGIVKIDNDDIPELIFYPSSMLYGQKIFWINGEEVKTESIDYDSFKYQEKQGVFFCSLINNGIYFDTVYKLEDHTLSSILQGRCSLINSEYFIDGESMDKTEYESKFNDLFDFNNAKEIDKWYSPSEIIDVISSY